MKVVLFCGGFGTRIREYSDVIPKPLVPIGYRPILWNVMKYYAYYGHNEFILCLGYKGDEIKKYFLNYNEAISNDFIMTGNGGDKIKLLSTDIHDWKITFVDTGLKSNIAQRLMAVKKYVEDDEYFLANYTDGLTDLPLDKVVKQALENKKIANFVSMRPSKSFDIVKTNGSGDIIALEHITKAGIWVNGGYFTFKHDIFNYIKPGEEIVYEPFQRLVELNQISTYRYDGFWVTMDTFKEKQIIDEMTTRGETPWEVWKNNK